MLETINYYHHNSEKIYTENNDLNEADLTGEEEFVYNKFKKEFLEIFPSMDNFTDVYSENKIKRDKDSLECISKENEFNEKTKKAALAEYILGGQIEEANFFGNCDVSYCSEYDDIKNHTDMALAFNNNEEEDGKPILLGIDVTTTNKKPEIEGKVDRILREIEDQKLGRLDYYDSVEYPELKGKNEFVPRVIIKFDKKEVQRLSVIMKKILLRETGSNKLMAEDKVQFQFLEEARSQLEIRLYHAIYGFLDKVEIELDKKGILEKEIAKSSYEIWKSWKERDIEKLIECIRNNHDIIAGFEDFKVVVVDKIMDAYCIIENIAKEKRSSLDSKENVFNQDVQAPMDKIREDREKIISFSPSSLYH